MICGFPDFSAKILAFEQNFDLIFGYGQNTNFF